MFPESDPSTGVQSDQRGIFKRVNGQRHVQFNTAKEQVQSMWWAGLRLYSLGTTVSKQGSDGTEAVLLQESN